MAFGAFAPRILVLSGFVAFAGAVSFALAGSPRTSNTGAAVQANPSVPVAQRPGAASADALDPIRIDALAGNADASAELAQQLISRFEKTGQRENLYEAFQWIARDWDRPEFFRTDVLQRAVTHHCDGPVLRWHWLCIAGE